MLTALRHSGTDGWIEVADLAAISDVLAERGGLLWAHAEVTHLTKSDVAMIAEEFGLHPLAVEDAFSLRQRPKLEAYDKHLFGVFHQLDEINGQLEAFQIACFIGRQFVVTLHHGSQRTIEEALRRCRSADREPGRGPSFIMHALLDTIVDDYQGIADRLEQEIEEIEDVVLQRPDTGFQTELYSLKQRLSRVRRYALPGERVLGLVIEPNRFNLITERTAALFRDVHDHMLRILDQIRNVEDLVDAVLDLQRSEQQTSLNETTKRLTGWAAIIAVPTFIASVYGMNFRLVPEDGKVFGFWFALSLMGASSVSLFVYFKRRGWL